MCTANSNQRKRKSIIMKKIGKKDFLIFYVGLYIYFKICALYTDHLHIINSYYTLNIVVAIYLVETLYFISDINNLKVFDNFEMF